MLSSKGKKNVNTFTTLSLRKYDKCVIESAQNSTRDVPQNLQLLATVHKMVVQYKLNCPVGMLHSISQRNISLQSTHAYISIHGSKTFYHYRHLFAIALISVLRSYGNVSRRFADFVSLMIKPHHREALAKRMTFFFTRSSNVTCPNVCV